MCNILIEMVRIIKKCLTETYIRGQVGKYLSDMIPVRDGWEKGDALSPLFLNFALNYALKKVQVNQDGLILNGTHQPLFYSDDVYILGESYIL